MLRDVNDLLNRPCSLIQRSPGSSTDAYGNDIPAETVVEAVCELQQRQRREPDAYGDLSDTLWLLVLPAGTPARTGDAVMVDGQEFEFVGDPWIARNPRTGVVSHIEATVRRTSASDDEGAGS
jgi:hypothetical protein